ncbi:MAG TPA: ABC transporter permease [Pseudolabrys sp.]|jgi:ribose transport system permease protein
MNARDLSLASLPIVRVPGVAIVLVVLCMVFALTSPGFATPANIANILTQSTILLLLALPMTLMIMTEGLDLSIGAVLTFSSIVLAVTVVATGSPTLAFLAALAVGLCFGFGNGVLIAAFDIPPFITTLGTLGIAQGLSLLVTDGQSVVGIPRSIEQIYSGTLAGIPLPIIMGALAYAVTHVLLYHTRFGTYVFALGGNREALRVAGISVRGMLIRVYLFGGFMAGVAALLMTARLNSAHPTAGIGMEFDAIAAVAVGGTSFERGNGWLLGTLLGVIAVGVLRNGLNLLAVPSSAQVACIGALVIVALFIDGLRSER